MPGWSGQSRRRPSGELARFEYADEEAARALKFELFSRFEERVPEPLRSSFYAALAAFLRYETTIFELPAFER